MPVNKYALLRYRIIDRCIGSQSYPNKEDLRQACEDSLYGSMGENISDSTIEKDLFAMRNEAELGYYAPIKYSKMDKGYYYEDEGYSISEFTLNDNDLEAIQIAASTLDQFKDNPIFQQYGSAIDKIVNRLKISPDPNDRQMDTFIQFENTPLTQGSEHLGPILEAIKDTRLMRITYQKFNSQEKKNYQIHPYLLKEYKSRWYLIAYEVNREDYLTFGLERIVDLKIQDEYFHKNEDFEIDRFFKHSFGITEINDSPKEVILRVSENQMAYFKSQPIHSSQEIKKEKNGVYSIIINVMITFELIQFILGYGNQIEVIKPQILRKRIKSNLEDTLTLYP